jgi:hypothetical protein
MTIVWPTSIIALIRIQFKPTLIELCEALRSKRQLRLSWKWYVESGRKGYVVVIVEVRDMERGENDEW